MQSDLGDCFSEIKKHLMQETKVCFIGTPCQVYGLKSYLRKEYDNLVTVDLVCHGTPSPKLWKKYLDEQKDKYHSEIDDIVEKINYIGLEDAKDFIEKMRAASFLPHTNIDNYPTVKQKLLERGLL